MPLPKAGDVLILPSGMRLKIHLVSENVVDISPDRGRPPIPLTHFAPAPNGEPDTWVLVGISSTDYARW